MKAKKCPINNSYFNLSRSGGIGKKRGPDDDGERPRDVQGRAPGFAFLVSGGTTRVVLRFVRVKVDAFVAFYGRPQRGLIVTSDTHKSAIFLYFQSRRDGI